MSTMEFTAALTEAATASAGMTKSMGSLTRLVERLANDNTNLCQQLEAKHQDETHPTGNDLRSANN